MQIYSYTYIYICGTGKREVRLKSGGRRIDLIEKFNEVENACGLVYLNIKESIVFLYIRSYVKLGVC